MKIRVKVISKENKMSVDTKNLKFLSPEEFYKNALLKTYDRYLICYNEIKLRIINAMKEGLYSIDCSDIIDKADLEDESFNRVLGSGYVISILYTLSLELHDAGFKGAEYLNKRKILKWVQNSPLCDIIENSSINDITFRHKYQFRTLRNSTEDIICNHSEPCDCKTECTHWDLHKKINLGNSTNKFSTKIFHA